jgi:hypothetical protein
MRPFALAMSIALGLCVAAPVRAQSFDGKWQVQTDPPHCGGLRGRFSTTPAGSVLATTVKGNGLSGVFRSTTGSAPFTTTVAPDGSFDGTVRGAEGRTFFIKGQFDKDSLTVSVTSPACTYGPSKGGRVAQ